MRVSAILLLILAGCVVASGAAADSAPVPPSPPPVVAPSAKLAPDAPKVDTSQNSKTATLCGALEAAATRSGLPLGFFTRLIWRESRFDPLASSRAGAQGVAQFMPATAGERGLVDPFEPTRALDEAAGYLSDLHEQFGNWGLAAAAYNAGPGRVGRWLAAGPAATLPGETLAYVAAITGHGVEEFRGAKPPAIPSEPGFSCLAFAGEAGRRSAPRAAPLPGGDWKPWAVILLGSFNRIAVVNEWARVRRTFASVLGETTPSVVRRRLGGAPAPKFVVQIETDNRGAGTQLCKRLLSAGGNCVVLRNASR